jgi:hypothetical protein
MALFINPSRKMKTDKNNLKQQKKQCLLVENHKESAFCNYKWEKKTQFIIKEEKKKPVGILL